MLKGLGCWGIRGIDELTVEELAHLHQQVEGWMSQLAHEADRTRCRP
jgi:hypothetical protein